MNNKVNGMMFNTGNVMNNTTGNPPSNFSRLEKTYTEFCEGISKTDFANSPRRYIIENTLVKDLAESAKEHKMAEKEEFYTKKAQEIAQKLKEFGIEIQ